MIGRDEITKVVAENLDDLRLMFGLGGWHIETEYTDMIPARTEGTYVRGEVSILIDYRRATITFVDSYESVETLLRTMIHELLHIVLADIESFADVANALAKGRGSALEDLVTDSGFSCRERQVNAVEFLLYVSMGMTPKKLARRARQR